MRKNVFFILVILAVCVGSCSEERTESLHFAINTGYGVCSMSDIIDTAYYIPLQVTKESSLSTANKLLYSDRQYFVFDMRFSKISVYDSKGRLSYVLNEQGHGKGEYLEIRNFTVAGGKLFVIDNFLHKIHVYSEKTGKYIASKDIELIPSDIVALDDGDFLLSVIPNGEKFSIGQSKSLVFRTDSNFTVKESYFPYDDGYAEPLSRYFYFSKSDGKVLFSSFGFDGFAEFGSGGGEAKVVAMDLNNPLPKESRNERENYGKDYQYVLGTPLMVGEYIYFEVAKGAVSQSYVYDTSDGKLYGNGKSAGLKMAYVIGCDGENFVGYVPDLGYYESIVKYGFAEADSATLGILKKGGSALVLYKLK